MQPDLESKAKRRKRPIFFWLLLLGFAYLSLSGWLRVIGSLNAWYWLSFANITPGPLYLVITGVLWGIIGLAALVWIWLRRPGYRQVGLYAALLFALTYWIDRLLFRHPEVSVPNDLFSVLLTLLCLLYVVLVLKPVNSLRKTSVSIYSKLVRNFGKD
jgi:hypothetical protein